MAVVSPMPAKNETQASKDTSETNQNSSERRPSQSEAAPENHGATSLSKKDDSLAVTVSEDPLKGLVPLGPLGLFKQSSSGNTVAGGKPTHQLPFSSKIDQFCGGTTIAANTALFQQGMTHGVF